MKTTAIFHVLSPHVMNRQPNERIQLASRRNENKSKSCKVFGENLFECDFTAHSTIYRNQSGGFLKDERLKNFFLLVVLPHAHGSPSGATVMWPISPAMPIMPCHSWP